MKIKEFFKSKLPKVNWKKIFLVLSITIPISLVSLSVGYFYSKLLKENKSLNQRAAELTNNLEEVQKVDPYKKNKELEEVIKNIHNTFIKAITVYEDILSLQDRGGNIKDSSALYAQALKYLSDQNYASASSSLTSAGEKVKEGENKLATTFKIPANVPVQNTPPGAGYSRQQVQTDAGNFLVSLVAADYGSTKVIVDTASASTCGNDCPVLPLATYVARSGAFAGINGSYFCPASYPTCAGKTNSFDLLVMNKDKTYFNSDNNVYSNNPGVVFGGGYIRFLSAVSQWGRDTSIDGMISNFPLLIMNGNITFGGDGDAKHASKGSRSFVAQKGNTIYIGVVHSATVLESVKTLKTLGMENAFNLDDGGSTALWSGGYKVGPGRDLPNVLLFVKR